MEAENLLVHMADSVSNRLYEFKAPAYKFWKKRDLSYYAEPDMEYLCDEMLCISEIEVKEYSRACDLLYGMYEKAAQHVIDNDLWALLGIPDNAIEIIKISWEKRALNPHLYGRFDLAGIINGAPAKLIEFNADTATVMPETAIIQEEQLRKAKIKGATQFNELSTRLAERFQEIQKVHPTKSNNILLSHMGHEEDILNLDIVLNAAKAAGLNTQRAILERVIFSPEEGIFVQTGKEEYTQFDYWFKLVPWEFIAYEEPDLMKTLTEIVKNDLAVILNPAYTMIYQSKAIMKILWDLYPNHYLLLKTSFSREDFKNRLYVKKSFFGREGENISVFTYGDKVLEENDGDYGNYPSIYQEFVELPMDRDDEIYQAGIYYTNKAAAISYRRRDGLITDEDSEFIGHYIL